MTAFQILEMKHFMAKLLTEDCFDSFLLEKASVSCAVSYEIDGRVNPEFYQDDETPDAGYLFLPWKSIRPVLFQMILPVKQRRQARQPPRIRLRICFILIRYAPFQRKHTDGRFPAAVFHCGEQSEVPPRLSNGRPGCQHG